MQPEPDLLKTLIFLDNNEGKDLSLYSAMHGLSPLELAVKLDEYQQAKAANIAKFITVQKGE